MRLRLLSVLFLVLGLSACSSDYTPEEIKTEPVEDRRNKGMGKFLGEDTLTFGGPKKTRTRRHRSWRQ